MGLFEGKKGLILGVANDHSIAWAIAKFILDEGGECGFTHLPDREDDARKKNHRRVSKLTDSEPNAKFLVPMDVTDTAFAAFMQAITLNMAVWYLVGQRNDIVSDAKQKAYDDAVLWLEKLGHGDVEPPVAAAPSATTTRDDQFAYGVGSDLTTSHRKFTRASQSGL